MENIVAERIQSYIMTVLGKQVSIVNSDGRIITSNSKKRIGETINLPQELLQSGKSLTISDHGIPSVSIPLSYNSQTVGAMVIYENPEQFSPQIPLVKSLAELLIQQYYESLKPDLDSTDKFIVQLLFNKDPGQLPLLASEAQVLGYRLDIPRMAFLIQLEGFWKNYLNTDNQFSDEKESIILRKKRDLESAIAGFFTKDTENITAYMGEDKFVLFKDIKNTPEDKVAKLLKHNFKSIVAPMRNFNITSVSAGIGRGYPGVTGLIKTFREADSALILGRKMWGNNRAFSYDELGIISIVGQGNIEKKLQFSQQLLHDLTNPDLLKTLESFFAANLNLTQTAEKLGIHRNTVIYRLDQISKILSRDPRIFEEAVEIKIALLIRQLLS